MGSHRPSRFPPASGAALALLLAAPPLAAASSYVIQRGDTLWKIAGRPDVYGDPWLWPLLWEENRDKMRNPDLIFPGRALAVLEEVPPERAAKARRFASRYDRKLQDRLPSHKSVAAPAKPPAEPKGPAAAPRDRAEAPPPAPAESKRAPPSETAPRRAGEEAVRGFTVVLLWLLGMALVLGAFVLWRLKRRAPASQTPRSLREWEEVRERAAAPRREPETEAAEPSPRRQAPAPEILPSDRGPEPPPREPRPKTPEPDVPTRPPETPPEPSPSETPKPGPMPIPRPEPPAIPPPPPPAEPKPPASPPAVGREGATAAPSPEPPPPEERPGTPKHQPETKPFEAPSLPLQEERKPEQPAPGPAGPADPALEKPPAEVPPTRNNGDEPKSN